MWNNKQASNPPGTSAGTGVTTLPEPVPATSSVHAPAVAPVKNSLEPSRTHGTGTPAPSSLGPGITSQGQSSGTEELQVECNVDLPISLGEHRRTVGQKARVNGEITASE